MKVCAMKLAALFFCFQIIVASPPSTSKVYRIDYVYNQKTNAFYKLHIDEANIRRARELCSLEGAKLMTLVNDIEMSQVHSMVKKYPDIDYVWIGDDGQRHPQADEKVFVFGEQPESHANYYYDSLQEIEKCEVINKFGEVKSLECMDDYPNHPFICKVDAKDAPYDETCEVYDTGYEYSATTGSCYKIPRVPLIWNAAYAACQAVGSHLVVVNSEAESQAVREIMHKAPRMSSSTHYAYFFAGYRTKGKTRDFITIFNQTLEQAGYAEWNEGEPNNHDNKEYCGSINLSDGKLNDINCNERFGFICEKEKRR